MWTPGLLEFINQENRVLARPIERVAIIGAGPAGLVAAYELMKCEGVQIDIFEASERVGGRVLTVGKQQRQKYQCSIFYSCFDKIE